MKPRLAPALFATAALAIVLVSAASRAEARPKTAAKKVLVELYTSQGCNSCPPASDLLGQLGELGYGPDRVVAVNFHVDYFNEPWADPFSDPAYSAREMAYNRVLKREDLYFTPMLMVNGRIPMLGSNRAKVVESLDQSLKGTPAVALAADLEGSGDRKTLRVRVAQKASRVAGRELLIGVAVTEDPVTTAVPSGENAGRKLVEHHVVRALARKSAKVAASKPATLEFALRLKPEQEPARSAVAVFVQDEASGEVYQAEALPWTEADGRR